MGSKYETKMLLQQHTFTIYFMLLAVHLYIDLGTELQGEVKRTDDQNLPRMALGKTLLDNSKLRF